MSGNRNFSAMAAVEVGTTLLLLFCLTMELGSTTATLNVTRKIPERFYFAPNDIYVKGKLDFEDKITLNTTFSGKELTEDEISRYTVDEKCSKGLPCLLYTSPSPRDA